MASHSIEDLTPGGPEGSSRGTIGETAFRRRGGGLPAAADLPEIRARGVGEILDLSIDVLRGRFLTCMALTIPLWVPAHTLSRVGMRFDESTQVLMGALSALPAAFVQILAIALVTIVVYGYLQGHQVRASKALLLGVKRAPALIITTILSALAIAAGWLCFCVPGIILSWLFMVAPAALVLERLGPIEALGRSVRLVHRSFWRWCGLMIAQTCLALPLTGAVSVLGNPLWRGQVRSALDMPLLLFDVLDIALVSLLASVSTSLAAVVLTVYYLDNRVRNEGFDLRMRFERLRERAPVEGLPSGGGG